MKLFPIIEPYEKEQDGIRKETALESHRLESEFDVAEESGLIPVIDRFLDIEFKKLDLDKETLRVKEFQIQKQSGFAKLTLESKERIAMRDSKVVEIEVRLSEQNEADRIKARKIIHITSLIAGVVVIILFLGVLVFATISGFPSLIPAMAICLTLALGYFFKYFRPQNSDGDGSD